MVSIETFRKLALQFDGSSESPHFERTSFRVKKRIYATLDVKNKKAILKLDELNQSVFSDFDSSAIYPVKGAWGKQGWTELELNKVRKDMLEDALMISYNLVSGISKIRSKST